MYLISAGVIPESSMARRMARSAPVPSGWGAVMWWASAVEAPPRISARGVAPRRRSDLLGFEDQDGGAFAHHEPVTIDVERVVRTRWATAPEQP